MINFIIASSSESGAKLRISPVGEMEISGASLSFI